MEQNPYPERGHHLASQETYYYIRYIPPRYTETVHTLTSSIYNPF